MRYLSSYRFIKAAFHTRGIVDNRQISVGESLAIFKLLVSCNAYYLKVADVIYRAMCFQKVVFLKGCAINRSNVYRIKSYLTL